jgi:dCTP deaminase
MTVSLVHSLQGSRCIDGGRDHVSSANSGDDRRAEIPMILTGTQIIEELRQGRVTIEPFTSSQVNPNSYNYRLGPRLRVIEEPEIDSANPPAGRLFDIPADGIVLEPGRVYLGATVESIGSHHFVPVLIGRSSLGRLGVFLQIAADLGQLGAIHCWTLEIVVAQPIRLYAGMIIGQVSFWEPTGDKSAYVGYLGCHSEPVVPQAGWSNLRRAAKQS